MSLRVVELQCHRSRCLDRVKGPPLGTQILRHRTQFDRTHDRKRNHRVLLDSSPEGRSS